LTIVFLKKYILCLKLTSSVVQRLAYTPQVQKIARFIHSGHFRL